MNRLFLFGLGVLIAALPLKAQLLFSDDLAMVPKPFSKRCIGGINVGGAEFGETLGLHGINYIYPTPEAAEYEPAEWWAERRLSIFRLPIRWEHLQPEAFGPLDAAELGRLKAAVTYYTRHGTLIIDLHNYGRYKGEIIASVEDKRLEDVWTRLVSELPASEKIVIGMMNEPYGIAADSWAAKAQSVINAIRSQGSRHIVLVPGTDWSGAHSWYDGNPSNADALAVVTDSANRLVFEAHQYLDEDSSGTAADCVPPEEAVRRLAPFTAWLKENARWGLLGEFGAAGSPECLASLEAMLAHMLAENVYVGWTYWTTGPWWSDDYSFFVDHASEAGDAQKTLLEQYTCR